MDILHDTYGSLLAYSLFDKLFDSNIFRIWISKIQLIRLFKGSSGSKSK